METFAIGMGKSARRAYALAEVSVVPTRRTRDPEDVDISWEIDAFTFEIPVLGAAMDSVTSPATAAELGRLGGAGILNLEGLWTRYAEPDPVLEEIAALPDADVTGRLQEIYAAPIQDELVALRIKGLKQAGVTAVGSVSPPRTNRLAPICARAGLDLLVIQGTVTSAEHVSTRQAPLNLKTFIKEYDLPVLVGGTASYSTALHLMRTGAVGVLVGVGSGAATTASGVLGLGVPLATAIADAAGARTRHLEETGRYVHVIADGGLANSGDVARAIACGADAVVLGAPLAAATEAPGRGFHWGMAAAHSSVPRGHRMPVPPVGTISEVLFGPAHKADGRSNVCGALRRTMAMCGYEDLRQFQKAEIVLTGNGAATGAGRGRLFP